MTRTGLRRLYAQASKLITVYFILLLANYEHVSLHTAAAPERRSERLASRPSHRDESRVSEPSVSQESRRRERLGHNNRESRRRNNQPSLGTCPSVGCPMEMVAEIRNSNVPTRTFCLISCPFVVGNGQGLSCQRVDNFVNQQSFCCRQQGHPGLPTCRRSYTEI